MNRRAFFGFAAGSLVAAPAAMLVGECPSNGRLALIGDIGPEIPDNCFPPYSVNIHGGSGDTYIRAIVRQGIQEVIRSRDDQMRRGGFDKEHTRYAAMKG